MMKLPQWAILFVLFGMTLVSCRVQASGYPKSDIEARTASYVATFNSNDLEALAAFWTEDADYVNPRTGVNVQGREAILEQFASLSEGVKESTLKVDIEKVEFLDANTAIEVGTAELTTPGMPPMETVYKVKYVLQNGEWLISRVSEIELFQATSHHEDLKALDWLIGNWIDEDEDVQVTSTFAWDKYKNFLTHSFDQKVFGRDELHGRQVIAWDHARRQIRSWLFDSDGGFGEGVWTQDGDHWMVEVAHTLPDGKKASAINVYTKIDGDSFSFESTGREINGELMPDIDPIVVRRKEG